MKNPVLKKGSYHNHCGEEDGSDHTEDFTLFDFYAAFAMAALIVNKKNNLTISRDDISGEALRQAKSMLEARGEITP